MKKTELLRWYHHFLVLDLVLPSCLLDTSNSRLQFHLGPEVKRDSTTRRTELTADFQVDQQRHEQSLTGHRPPEAQRAAVAGGDGQEDRHCPAH